MTNLEYGKKTEGFVSYIKKLFTKDPVEFRSFFCNKLNVEFDTGTPEPSKHDKETVYIYKDNGGFTDDEKKEIIRYIWAYVSTYRRKQSFHHICFRFYAVMIVLTMLAILIVGWLCVAGGWYTKLLSFTIDVVLVIPVSVWLYLYLQYKHLYKKEFSIRAIRVYYGEEQIKEYMVPKPYSEDIQKDFFAIYIAFLILFSFQVSALIN